MHGVVVAVEFQPSQRRLALRCGRGHRHRDRAFARLQLAPAHRELKGAAIDFDPVGRAQIGGPGGFEGEQYSGKEAVQRRAGAIGQFDPIQPECRDGLEDGVPIMVATPISSYGEPLDYSPCLKCKLCVAACPVGAIKKDGDFDFFACSTHNYREFMGGFTDWVQTVADSTDAADFRSRVSDSENASMWQSLSC